MPSLVAEAERDDEHLGNLPGPPHLTPRDRAELDRMLPEGLGSGPPVRVTPEFWEERRRVLKERMAVRRKSGPAGTWTSARSPWPTSTPPAEYLEAERKGGGDRFRDDPTARLARVQRLPERAPRHDPPAAANPGRRVARRKKVKWYGVFYLPTPDGLLVVRVLHLARDVAAAFTPPPGPATPPGS